MKRKILIALLIIGAGAVGIFLMRKVQVNATTVTIDENLTVTPSVIPFETVFPGEILFKPLNIRLSDSFMNSLGHDDVEYRILQKTKPRIDSDVEREYCQQNPNDETRCYPSLCPYLSKEPDGTPTNDTSVPAFHNPTATSSIAIGRLAKTDNDTEDQWTVDLHVPCFKGECDQANQIPFEYQLDPKYNGTMFGCDLIVEVTRVSYFITRTPGFWQTHTQFTSDVFQSKLGGSMMIGTPVRSRIVTNLPGQTQSRLFGAFYSSISKKTNNSSRALVDKTRMQLLQHLVSAKLNCGVFTCAPATQTLVSNADAAYAAGNIPLMQTYTTQLDQYNNVGDGQPIPPELGDPGSATPDQSQWRANKIFWDNP